MYQYTLASAKEGGLQGAAAACSDSDEFIEKVNKVQRRLLKRGNWFDTELLFRFCVYNACVTWPRWVGAVTAMRPCRMPSVEIRNNWYAIYGPSDCFAGQLTMRDAGTGPCYNEISGTTGKKIRAYAEKSIDIGRKITIYGTDAATNLPLRMPDGTPGLELVLTATYVETTVDVKHITAVTKDETKGYVFLYEYETATALTRDLAMYEGNETNPRYRKSLISNLCAIPACPESDGVQMHRVDVMAKLEFIPVKNDSDFLIIDDFDALGLGLQALRMEEANNDVEAELKWRASVKEMNFRDRNKSPNWQTTVSVDATMGRCITSPM